AAASNTPAAISIAVSSLTAPKRSKVSTLTPRCSTLASLLYVTKPRSNQSLDPGVSVIAAASKPPVQDSAHEILHPFASSIFPRRAAVVVDSISFMQTSLDGPRQQW